MNTPVGQHGKTLLCHIVEQVLGIRLPNSAAFGRRQHSLYDNCYSPQFTVILASSIFKDPQSGFGLENGRLDLAKRGRCEGSKNYADGMRRDVGDTVGAS